MRSFLFLLLLPFSALALGPYDAEVVKVIDGDTVKLDVHIWIDLTQRINLRLDGVNTPEKKGKGVPECEKKLGQEATNFTQRWLKDVETVQISNVRKGKYAGRALGQISKNEEDLGQALIDAGLARDTMVAGESHGVRTRRESATDCGFKSKSVLRIC